MSYVTFNGKFGQVEATFSIQRVSYNIEDTLREEMENGNISHYKKITVRGKMKKSELETYKIVCVHHSAGNVSATGRINGNGDLYFSDTSDISKYYMKIKSVSIISISETDKTWTEWGDIEAVFSDDTGNDANSGILEFDGTSDSSIQLYNANLNISFPKIRRRYVSVNNYSGSFIQDMGYDFININLTGSIPYDSCEFPEHILKIIESYEKSEINSKEDYPICKSLKDFIPTISNCEIDNVFVADSSLTWNIEKKEISVNITMIAPNQKIESLSFVVDESDSG